MMLDLHEGILELFAERQTLHRWDADLCPRLRRRPRVAAEERSYNRNYWRAHAVELNRRRRERWKVIGPEVNKRRARQSMAS